MALNSRITNNKFGSIEKMLNRYLIFFVVVLVMEMVVSTILTMEKGVEYIDTDQSFNESTTIERLRFLGNISHFQLMIYNWKTYILRVYLSNTYGKI